METVYFLRCPNQADFVAEEEGNKWFNMDIPRSNQLRQKIQSPFYHGWFCIDISITDNKEYRETIERWYMIHIPSKQTETTPSITNFNNLKDLKFYTYRRFSQFLRSIYSMINVLPATNLGIVLKQLKTSKLQMSANISAFQKFPAQIKAFCDSETSKLRFGPVVTPIGQTVVICHYRVDLMPLIPTPIRAAPHYKFNTGSFHENIQDKNSFQEMSTVHDTYGTSVPNTSPFMTQSSVVDIQSFIPDAFGQFEPFDSIPKPSVEDVMSISDFINYLDSFQTLQCADINGDSEYQTLFSRVKSELDCYKNE